MQINRLLEIVMLLMNRESVTARTLAERFGVSARTIYRDVEALSGAGVPVYMTKGKGGGISLLPEFSLNKTLLSQEDKDNLSLALQTLKTSHLPELDPTLEKIGSLFKVDADEWVQVDFTRWGSGPGEANKFRQIKEAILQRRVMEIKYLSSLGVVSTRMIEPLRLIYKGQAWYLQGYCRLKEDFRIFRISRVRELTLIQETFVRKPIPRGRDIDQNGPGPYAINLVLRFDARAGYRVFDDFNPDQITCHGDGSYTVSVTFSEDEWVYGYILSFGNQVEVCAPAHVRQIIKQRLQDSLKKYPD